MGIVAAPQEASQATGAWIGDATVSVAGMTVTVGGSVTLPGLTDGQPDPSKPRVTTPLSAAVAITAPTSGTAHNLVAVGWDGTVYLNPGDVALAAYLAWMDVPAGCVDLSTVPINVLHQTDPSAA